VEIGINYWVGGLRIRDKMNEQKLRDFGRRILEMLKEYGIPSEAFGINIYVPREYFDTLRIDFDLSDTNVISAMGKLWSVNLMDFEPIPPDSDKEFNGPLPDHWA
jgi:hypothetical protein